MVNKAWDANLQFPYVSQYMQYNTDIVLLLNMQYNINIVLVLNPTDFQYSVGYTNTFQTRNLRCWELNIRYF